MIRRRSAAFAGVVAAAAISVTATACASADPSPTEAQEAPLSAASAPSAAATTGPPRLPGPCVSLPTRGWRFDRTVRQASPPDPSLPIQSHAALAVEPHRTVDVDGDGALDLLVPDPAADDCPHDVHLDVYVTRGACGHHVGTVVGPVSPDVVLRPGSLADLTTQVQAGHQEDPRGVAQLRTVTRLYRFDGATYREIHRSEGSVDCHHCGTARCASSPMP